MNPDQLTHYDRYSKPLLPAWLKVVIGLFVAALVLLLIWLAGRPGPDSTLARVLGIGLPLVAIGALLLVRAEE